MREYVGLLCLAGQGQVGHGDLRRVELDPLREQDWVRHRHEHAGRDRLRQHLLGSVQDRNGRLARRRCRPGLEVPELGRGLLRQRRLRTFPRRRQVGDGDLRQVELDALREQDRIRHGHEHARWDRLWQHLLGSVQDRNGRGAQRRRRSRLEVPQLGRGLLRKRRLQRSPGRRQVGDCHLRGCRRAARAGHSHRHEAGLRLGERQERSCGDQLRRRLLGHVCPRHEGQPVRCCFRQLDLHRLGRSLFGDRRYLRRDGYRRRVRDRELRREGPDATRATGASASYAADRSEDASSGRDTRDRRLQPARASRQGDDRHREPEGRQDRRRARGRRHGQRLHRAGGRPGNARRTGGGHPLRLQPVPLLHAARPGAASRPARARSQTTCSEPGPEPAPARARAASSLPTRYGP